MSEHKPLIKFTPVPVRSRHDGWTVERQYAFVEKLADTNSITAACKHVGMSRESVRKLRRRPKPGRAGVVVPNGTLFGDGVCARIKEELLTDFNLHTIVRLPNGVFAPYTPIPTNLLFFDRSGPTKEVWYYEQLLPEGRKQYTKTQPLQFEAFADCLAWWTDRKETDRAWKVPAAELLEAGCNLDRKNPNAKQDFEHLPPEQLADDILQKELRIAEIMREIKELLGRKP